MPKITAITPEQKAQIPVYIQKWVELSSEPVDREKANKVLREIYPDRLVIHTNSFQNTFDIIRFVLDLCQVKKVKYDPMPDSQLYSQLDSQLDSQNVNWSYCVTVWWGAWAGYYDYARMIGVKFDAEILENFFDIILNTSIYVFVGGIIFVCEKPKVIWDDGIIHSETKPAISWDDDTGIYYLNGVKFEKETWEKVVSEKMTFKEILEIDNTEQRLIAMRYNPNALLSENPNLVHRSERGNELWLIENSEINKIYDEKKVWLLGFIDPSKKAPNNKMYEEVNPELCKTTNDADLVQAYHLGLTYEEYQLLKIES